MWPVLLIKFICASPVGKAAFYFKMSEQQPSKRKKSTSPTWWSPPEQLILQPAALNMRSLAVAISRRGIESRTLNFVGRQIHRAAFEPPRESPCNTRTPRARAHAHFPGHLESTLAWKSTSRSAERLASSVLLPRKTSITPARRLTAAICEETGCDGR